MGLTPFYSFIVIMGWILGKPLTLLFDPFESIVLFLSGEDLYPLSLQLLMVFLRSLARHLRRTRWPFKLAQGHDSRVCVYPPIRAGSRLAP